MTLWSSDSGLAIAQRRHVGQPQLLERLGAGERVGDDLGQPAAAQLVLEPPAQPLRRVQPADRLRARGQRRRDRVEAVDAPDLLDQVGLALHVAVAPVGDGHVVDARARPTLTPYPSESRIASISVARHLDAEQPLASAPRAGGTTRGSARLRVDVDRAGHVARAAQLDHQPRGQPLRGDRVARGGAASRTARDASVRSPSFASERMMFGPTQVAASISTRVVLSGDLGDLAAHDPGDARRALGVGDDRDRRVERRARRRRASSSSRPRARA